MAVLLGGYALAGGALSFLGWAAGVYRLTDWGGTGITIKPNAALAATLAGAAVLLVGIRKVPVWLPRALGVLVATIGGLTLLQHLTGWNFGIDTLLFDEPPGAAATAAPGRMGPPASTSFLLLGTAVVLLSLGPRSRKIAPGLGVVVAGLGFLTLVGYWYGAEVMYSLPRLSGIAVQTTSFLLGLGLAVVVRAPEADPVRTLLEPSAAGTLARRVLPFLVIIPVLLGWLRVRGQGAGLYDTAFGTALFMLTLVALLLTLLWRNVGALSRYEAALRRTETQITDILASITDGFVTIGPDWRYSFVNEEAARLMGKRPEDLLGKVVWEVFPEAVDSPAYRELQRAMTERVSVEFEAENPVLQQWYANKAYPTANGGLAVYFQDITRHRQLRAALQAREQQLQHVSDHAAVLVAQCSRDLRYVFVNKTCADFLGLPPERIIGRPIGEVIGEEALETIRPYINRVLAGERVEYESEVPYAVIGRRYMRVVYVPDFDERAQVRGWIAAISDITARREAEAALQQSEERYRSLVSVITDVPWTTDADGAFVAPQPHWTRYTGQSWDEHRGFGWVDALHPDDRDRVRRVWEEARAAQGDVYQSEGRLWHAESGTYRYFLARATPLRSPDGSVREWVGTCTDVQESRAALQALREADRRKDEFLATLAHELRNPLAPVVHGLEILERDAADPAIRGAAQSLIRRQVGHLVRLVDDLIDVSRISRDTLELRRQPVELGDLLRQVAEAAQSHAQPARQSIGLDLPEEPVWLDADPARLSQVFGNLLSNACKFSPEGGRIRLRSRREGSDVVISVRDNGTGIPLEQQGELFKMFARIQHPLANPTTGLGIGLHLVKRLVELHGGSVSAASEGAGRGSEFTVRLPLTVPAPAVTGKPDVGARQSLPGRRILVVDDNEDAASSLTTLLSLTGSETATAADGHAALEKAAHYRPQVILLDLGLPKLNGYETCRAIREQPWGKDVVIIAITGWGQESDREQTRLAGFDAHLVKPVDYRELLQLLTAMDSARRPPGGTVPSASPGTQSSPP